MLQICLAQEYGASGVVFILNDVRPYVFRATGEVPRLLLHSLLSTHSKYTGDHPCELITTPLVMVTKEDGKLLRNASSLSVYSTYRQSSNLYMGIYLGCSVSILSIPSYQALMLHLILRRSRFSFFSYFQLNLRPILFAVAAVVVWLLLAWIMFRSRPKPSQECDTKCIAWGNFSRSNGWPCVRYGAPTCYSEAEWSEPVATLVEYVNAVIKSTCTLFVSVTLGVVALHMLKAQAHRNKLRLVAKEIDAPRDALSRTRFVEQVAPSDGNSLFHSMSYFLLHCGQNLSPFGSYSDTAHASLRCEIIDHLKAHSDDICVGSAGLLLRSYVETEMKGVDFDKCAPPPNSTSSCPAR